MDYNKKNRKIVAETIIEDWHPDILYHYALEKLIKDFENSEKLFNEDVNSINE